MASDILVIAEVRDGALRKGIGDVVAVARQLADAGSGKVDVLVPSAAEIAGLDALGRDEIGRASRRERG